MPTGYTADVGDGKVTDFRTFALRCSRAFGATIMQRDNPADELPQHREMSDYHVKALAEARAELARLVSLPTAEAEAQMALENAAATERNETYRIEIEWTRARYESMLGQVRAWDAPTDDHVGYRDFMINELEDSIKWDCPVKPHQETVYATVKDWLAEKRRKNKWDREYHAKELQAEIQRVDEANAWIDALYASLDLVPA